MFYDLLRAPSLCVIWAPKCPFVRYCKSYFDRASPYTRCESELQLLRTITWWVHFSLCTLYEKNIATSIKVDFSEFLLSSHICTLKNPCITYCAGTPQKDTTLPMKNWTKLFSHCTEALFRIIRFFSFPYSPIFIVFVISVKWTAFFIVIRIENSVLILSGVLVLVVF